MKKNLIRNLKLVFLIIQLVMWQFSHYQMEQQFSKNTLHFQIKCTEVMQSLQPNQLNLKTTATV